MIRSAAVAAVMLLSAGCAALPPPIDATSWARRRAELQALDAWALDGRVAVATAAQGFSGGLAWRQDGAQAEIGLRGPFGATALSIRLDGEEMTVSDSGGDAIAGAAARQYLVSEIGAPLPVAELRYWLVGVPAPQFEYLETMGADGRLVALEQAGWRLRYSRYQAVDGYALPALIEISSESARLRLAVARWRLAQ